jgi:hypothetical protein
MISKLAKRPRCVKKIRLEREEERRREEKKQYRRSLRQRWKQREKNRWRHFQELAGQWEEADLARRFLNELEPKANRTEIPPKSRDWLNWARQKLIRRDPLQEELRIIFNELAEKDSFGT